jgi:hypothetical protein
LKLFHRTTLESNLPVPPEARQLPAIFPINPAIHRGAAARTVVSRQLILQSSPDIEDFIAGDLSTAIGVAVDSAALNGAGTAPQPVGILHYPVNASGSYTYASRSANVTFGGPASWASVLSFEKILEQGLIVNDGTFGYATDPTVRDKWEQVAKLFIRAFCGNNRATTRSSGM